MELESHSPIHERPSSASEGPIELPRLAFPAYAPEGRAGAAEAGAAEETPRAEASRRYVPPPPPPLPLLITGIAGVAGYNALQYFQRLYPGQVIGTRRPDNGKLIGEGIEACDADDHRTLARLFRQYGFRSVLNSEGSCKLKSCELDPRLAWRLNTASVQGLLHTLEELPYDVRLVHLSIDLVYSGLAGGEHVEEDPPDPVTVYGQTMAEAERRVLEQFPQACVLRISLPMGISPNGHAGAIDWIQSRFQKGRPATLYHDEIRTPQYTDCLNHTLHTVLAQPVPLAGVFHAGGPRKLSLYEIAQIVSRVGGYDPALLMGCRRWQAGPIPPRAGDVTMNSGKLIQTLGYGPFDPWPYDDQWVPTDPQWHWERKGPVGSPELLAEILYRNPLRC